MQGQTNDFTKLAAKQLRKTMTEAEQRLWHCLRGQQLDVKFRRQHPFKITYSILSVWNGAW
nr:DUF559 domain-containing protein [Herbaspirillum frisingense]